MRRSSEEATMRASLHQDSCPPLTQRWRFSTAGLLIARFKTMRCSCGFAGRANGEARTATAARSSVERTGKFLKAADRPARSAALGKRRRSADALDGARSMQRPHSERFVEGMADSMFLPAELFVPGFIAFLLSIRAPRRPQGIWPAE